MERGLESSLENIMYVAFCIHNLITMAFVSWSMKSVRIGKHNNELGLSQP